MDVVDGPNTWGCNCPHRPKVKVALPGRSLLHFHSCQSRDNTILIPSTTPSTGDFELESPLAEVSSQ